MLLHARRTPAVVLAAGILAAPLARAAGPDLTIDTRHVVDFADGTPATITCVVTNVGTAATTGVITVRDTLASGLAFAGGTGAVWSFVNVGPAIAASTANTILPGDSLVFTLAVTVGPAAVPGVTNAATVSGGGDVTAANNRDTDAITVTGVPDLTLDVRHLSNFVPGTNGAFTFVVRNLGSATTAGTITVADTLPAGLGFVSGTGGTWTFTVNGAALSASTTDSLAVGDSLACSVTVSVGPAAIPSVTNTATVSGGGDVSPANDRDSDFVPVAGGPDLTIDLRHTGTLNAGSAGAYQVVVRNVGSLPTTGTVSVRDTLPLGLGYVNGSGIGWSVGPVAGIVVATYPAAIAAGDSATFLLTVSVTASAAPAVTNAATVSGGGDLSPANNRDTDPTVVSAPADLAIAKSAATTFTVGGLSTYRIAVRNIGVGPTTSTLTVRDTLAAGLVYFGASGVGWSVASAGGIVTATNAGPIAAGDSAAFNLTVSVAAAAVPSVRNDATVSGGGDSNPLNDRAGVTVPVTGVPDLTIDVRHTANFVQGTPGTFTLVVRNIGSGPTAGVISVIDTLPAGLAFASGAGAGWSFSNASGVITAASAGPIAVGDSMGFTLGVTVGPGAIPGVTNTAVVQGGGDASVANNRDVDTVPVAGMPDLAIDLRHTAAFVAGGPGRYTVVVRNAGTGPTTGTFTVLDTLPAGLTYAGASGFGWTFAQAGAELSATSAATLAAGDSLAFACDVAVGAAAAPAVTNAASVTGGGDASPANNRDTDPTSVTVLPDLALSLRELGSFVAGSNAGYRITVRNLGLGATSGTITARDTLPAGLAFVSGAGPGWTVTASGARVTATRTLPVAPGDSVSFTLDLAVAPAAMPGVVNAATVSVAGDPNAANDRDAVTTLVGGAPDLAIDVRHGATFVAGVPGTYTIVVGNLGTAASSGMITVRDTLPAGLTFASGAGAGWAIATSGAVVTATTPAPIAIGDSLGFTVSVAVAVAASPGVVNAATVTGGGDTTPANDRDADTTVVIAVPDLALTKSVGGVFAAGYPASYRLSVRNVGSRGTSGTITVRDTLPASLAFESGAGPGWTVSHAAGVVTATRAGALATGDTAAFTLTVAIAPSAGARIDNTAFVTVSGDTNRANDRSTASAAVVTIPDLVLDVRHTGAFVAGDTARYLCVVTNRGLAVTSGAITVLDTLPAGLTFVAGSGSGWTATATGAVVTATATPDLAPGDSTILSLDVAVGAAARPSVTNAASVSGGGDTTPADDRDIDTVPVSGGVDLAIDVRHTSVFVAGHPAAWRIVVRNVGTLVTASAVTVRDTLPAGFAFASLAGSGWTSAFAAGVLTASPVAALAPGDSAAFDLAVLVAPDAPAASVDAASVANAEDIDPVNDRDVDATPVQGGVRADLALAKAASSPEAEIGGVVDYLVTLRNDGGAAADSSRVVDRLPAGFRYQPGSARLDGARLADPTGAPGPVLEFPIGRIAAGAVRELRYRVVLGPGAMLGSGVNVASAHARGPAGEAVASGAAAAKVRVRPGPFSDLGIIVGKVFADCDCGGDGRQGHEDPGVPGVRIVLEDGTSAITDAEGKYSFDAVSARLHVVRVDESTLPAGAVLRLSGALDAGQPHSRFVDLRSGELFPVDFRIASRDSAVLARIRERRALGEVTHAMSGVSDTSAADSAASRPRRLLVSGLIDARADWRSLSDTQLGDEHRDRLDDALLDVRSSSNDGRLVHSGRGALWLSGELPGDLRVSGRWDSESNRERRLFRDLRPFDGYPILGDASMHEWPAPSDARGFARLERHDSFAQFGDFRTPVREVRELGAFTRAATGGLARLGGEATHLEGFATRGRSRLVVDEIAGLGISGPYTLSRADGTLGSERVELVTRDRNQPARILAREPLTRFTDYTLEPFTGRLLFRRPVPSVDAELNPVTIRVSYEVEGGGREFATYGADAAITPREGLTLGAAVARDEDPSRPGTLASLDASLAPAAGVRLTGEFARSDSGGTVGAGLRRGEAWRGALDVTRGGLDAHAFVLDTGRAFDNPSADAEPGRRDLGGRARVPLGGATALFANALRRENTEERTRHDGFEAGLSRGFGAALSAEGAYRWSRETHPDTAGALPDAAPHRSARARLAADLPLARPTHLFAEVETALGDSLPKRWAVGADVPLTATTKLYAREENLPSFTGPYDLDARQHQVRTVVGLAGGGAREAQVFSEYRLRGALAGRESEAAIGLRNRWTIGRGTRLDASFERTQVLAGAESAGAPGEATSATTGLEWTGDPLWKGSARLEWRDAARHEQVLGTLGLARTLGRNWSTLVHGAWRLAPGDDAEDRAARLGLAYRPADGNALRGLARGEHRFTQSHVAGAPSLERTSNTLASVLAFTPVPRWTLTTQAAMRWLADRSDDLSSRTTMRLLGGRARLELTPRVDLGAGGRLLAGDAGAQWRKGVGGECGLLLGHGVRGVIGYNVFGFHDDGLAIDHSDQGPYVEIGLKFDETSLAGVRWPRIVP